jgi:glycine hydroxymethyltransferase
MREIAELIALAIRSDPEAASGKAQLAEAAERVTALVAQFPAYPVQAVASPA